MRMWQIDPKLLCNKHLNGEHGEIHKFLPSFRKGVSVTGRFYPSTYFNQIELCSLEKRHDELADEINRRAKIRGKGGHKSPLLNIPDLEKIYPEHFNKEVDPILSEIDLCLRCPECRERILNERLFIST